VDSAERAERIKYAENQKPRRLSREQAQKLQADNAPKRLTGGGKSGIINHAKVTDIFENYNSNNTDIDFEKVVELLENSEVGTAALAQLSEKGVKPIIDHTRPRWGERGSQQGNIIRLYVQAIPNEKVAAQTLIHETTHLYYGIGQSQWAEAVCFAKEKMFLTGRSLTMAERRYIVKLAKDNYPEFEWRRGGTERWKQIK
ncbi:hypothetical protein, partial [Ruminococcus sp.]|uniref:hypothetical protein n=1 Tax=Ruminococcus sp. TaxID=41978 RepID=UPI001B0055A4